MVSLLGVVVDGVGGAVGVVGVVPFADGRGHGRVAGRPRRRSRWWCGAWVFAAGEVAVGVVAVGGGAVSRCRAGRPCAAGPCRRRCSPSR